MRATELQSFVCANGNIAKRNRSRSCILRSAPFEPIVKSLSSRNARCFHPSHRLFWVSRPPGPRKANGSASRLHRLAEAVAPRNPNLGVMLPYSPLHHLLMRELSFPVVATSGNLSDEPICIDEHEALQRLRGIADLFLVHDRPIVRHVD